MQQNRCDDIVLTLFAESLITFGLTWKSNLSNENIFSYNIRYSVAAKHTSATRHIAYTFLRQRHTPNTQVHDNAHHTNAHHHTGTMNFAVSVNDYSGKTPAQDNGGFRNHTSQAQPCEKQSQ